MDNSSLDRESLLAHIQEVERERDELRKDIEQLCTQQGGSSYIYVATRMHLQRTAGLEQQMDKLKKELAQCTRDKRNLKEELSEAFRIRAQLEKHHRTEIARKSDAEQQLKFFQESVTSAYADRDQASMEAEEAKEKAELLKQKLDACQQKLNESTSDALNAHELVVRLQADLAKWEHDTENFKKVVDKYYKIRQQCLGDLNEEQGRYDEKCTYLLEDLAESWSFHAHKEIIGALEEERNTLIRSAANIQQRLQLGLDIEKHLKRKVHKLESEKELYDCLIKDGISILRQYHLEQRNSIKKILDEGRSFLMSVVDAYVNQVRLQGQNEEEHIRSLQTDIFPATNDHGVLNPNAVNVGSNEDVEANIKTTTTTVDTSGALSQALHEKVSALLLLQQQEERHFLERNVNAVLLERLNELQECLNQVTKEKLEALMKLEISQRQLLKGHEKAQEKLRTTTTFREGRFKNMLRSSSVRRWIGPGYEGVEDSKSSHGEGSFSFRRMKIENATLNESLKSLQNLTSGIQRLRFDLLKAKEALTSGVSSTGVRILEDIINEAYLVKTTLGSSISANEIGLDAGVSSSSSSSTTIVAVDVDKSKTEDLSVEKVKTVSSAGSEMVELLLLAAQIMVDKVTR